MIASTNVELGIFQCCKGRLSQLSETLPHNLEAARDRSVLFTLVDYSCPDGTTDWVLKERKEDILAGRLAVLHVETGAPWRMATVKNISGRLAARLGAKWLLSLDADNYVTPRELKIFDELSMRGIAYHGLATMTDGSCGRIGLPTSLYLSGNGFREDSPPAGAHDKDLIARIHASGTKIFRRAPDIPAIANSVWAKIRYTTLNSPANYHKECLRYAYPDTPPPPMPQVAGKLYYKTALGTEVII